MLLLLVCLVGLYDSIYSYLIKINFRLYRQNYNAPAVHVGQYGTESEVIEVSVSLLISRLLSFLNQSWDRKSAKVHDLQLRRVFILQGHGDLLHGLTQF